MAKNRRLITEKEFIDSLGNGDKDFSMCQFDFDVFIEDQIFDHGLNFEHSVFNGNFRLLGSRVGGYANFKYTHFNEKVSLANTTFEDDVTFKQSIIKGRISAFSTIFKGRTFFSYARFNDATFLTKAKFEKDAFFKKCRFKNDLIITKTFFGNRADFSYSHFSDSHVTSFLGLKRFDDKDGKSCRYAPKFIFRNLFFGNKTIFTEVNLSESIFDSCVIEPVKFKNCIFSEKDGRKCFYEEVANTFYMKVNKDAFLSIKDGKKTIDFRLNDEKRRNIRVGDRIFFINQNNPQEVYSVLVVGRHEEKNFEALFADMKNVYNRLDFDHIRMFLSEVYPEERQGEESVLALEFKNFSEKAKYENLVDINRQMKKSLEDSKDWQTAGDFYRGEMEANIKLMDLKKEKFTYRWFLRFFNLFSGFAEDTSRILASMGISFAVVVAFMCHFNPEFTIFRCVELAMYFLIPMFGGRGVYLSDLDMESSQSLVILILVTWFYLLWTILAINLFRRFKR